MTKPNFSLAASRRAVLAGVLLFSGGLRMAEAQTQAGAIEAAGVFGAAANLPDISSGLQNALNQVAGSGFTVSGGSNFKWYGGGSIGVAISPHFLVVGDVNYNHAGTANISYGSGASSISFSETLSLTDFTGGVHWQLPVSSKTLVPYLAAGVGGVRQAVTASGSGVPNVGASETDLTFNFGGGVRYYIKPSWGIRPEVEYVRIPGQNYVRFGVGLFWQSKH